jgi:F-type H+-transporting ATPase subunit gamma
MSNPTTASLRRKIGSAGDLQSVVRTMKALAAANIGQYERSVRALGHYCRSVELGLSICFRNSSTAPIAETTARHDKGHVGVVVFGSDQGLVGRFNAVVADFTLQAIAELPGKCQVWAVGERVHARLAYAGLALAAPHALPTSVQGITPLVGRILIESEAHLSQGEIAELHLFYNRPTSGAIYEPVHVQLLPLDNAWRLALTQRPWPSRNLPEIMASDAATLHALIGEYLFVSLFRACAESLASENASRLAAMQRADQNIDELLEGMNSAFHRLRQSGIDEELFDVTSGFEALSRH